MKNAGIAAIVAALLALGTMPAATAYDAKCEEKIQTLRNLLQDTDQISFEQLRDASEGAAAACNGWSIAGPAVGLTVTTAATTTAALTSPTLSNICAAGGVADDEIPVSVTFKVGGTGASVTINDEGPGGVEKYADGTIHYWVDGDVVGLDAWSTGTGAITMRGVEVMPGGAWVKPLCAFSGAGTCGGEATVESNTDRLSATGYSTFFACL